MKALQAFGAPPFVITAMTNFYRRNTMTIKVDNTLYEGFTATRGIRQGCPLSPLIYAISTDSLMRILQQELPNSMARAFADDTAIVLSSWSRQSGKMNRIMSTFSDITTMRINNSKTIAIFLGDKDKHPNPDAQQPKYTWAGSGRYLGFMIGPEAKETSWDAPIKKYLSRLEDWPWKLLGTHLSLKVYNTFILPTRLFIAQLQHPPKGATLAEHKVANKLVAGRGNWCSAQDLAHLHCLGSPTELRALERNAKAAMTRVTLWENASNGCIQWKRLSSEIYTARRNNDHFTRNIKHNTWHDNHFPTIIHNHHLRMTQDHNINQNTARSAITKHHPLPLPQNMHNRWKNKLKGGSTDSFAIVQTTIQKKLYGIN